MYKGYNLSITIRDFGAMFSTNSVVGALMSMSYASQGKVEFNQYQQEASEQLRALNFFTTSKILDGNEIEEVWFPKIDSQVFISHSHADTDLAFALSGWLKARFGVTSFIDSAVWGYRGDLIRKLSHGLDSADTQKMVEHVDCMLVKSLMQMIDQCECLMFLNTPNSINAKGVIAETYSPWLFCELNTSRYIRENKPQRYRLHKVATVDEAISNSSRQFSLKISHEVPVNHLGRIDAEKLKHCLRAIGDNKGEKALDILYRICS